MTKRSDLRAREHERTNLRNRVAALETDTGASGVSRSAVRTRLSAYLADLRKVLLVGETAQVQALLGRLVRDRLTFAPQADGAYTFTGKGTVEPVLSGVIPNVASLEAASSNQLTSLLDSLAALVQAGIHAPVNATNPRPDAVFM